VTASEVAFHSNGPSRADSTHGPMEGDVSTEESGPQRGRASQMSIRAASRRLLAEPAARRMRPRDPPLVLLVVPVDVAIEPLEEP
jgi:hypothetical protein